MGACCRLQRPKGASSKSEGGCDWASSQSRSLHLVKGPRKGWGPVLGDLRELQASQKAAVTGNPVKHRCINCQAQSGLHTMAPLLPRKMFWNWCTPGGNGAAMAGELRAVRGQPGEAKGRCSCGGDTSLQRQAAAVCCDLCLRDQSDGMRAARGNEGALLLWLRHQSTATSRRSQPHPLSVATSVYGISLDSVEPV